MIRSLQLDGIRLLAGTNDITVQPRRAYDDLSTEFLAALSAALRACDEIRDHPDIATFAFWCRKANIAKLKSAFEDGAVRMGRGLAFHVTPSNVAVNFAYSFAFGLLAGNANIVRVPSAAFPQVDILCREIDALFGQPAFQDLRTTTALISYPRDDAITERLSARSDARIIWGGDETVRHIRQFPLPVRGVEVAFADRYSLSVMAPSALSGLDARALEQLAAQFYNDAYLMDQNACSSPHLVIWMGPDDDAAKDRFWQALGNVVSEKYGLEPVFAVDKYTHLLETAANSDTIKSVDRIRNDVYRVELARLTPDIEALRGRFGTFFEYRTETLEDLAPFVTARFQTLTYFGVDAEWLADFVVRNGLTGIDRIVPVGQALDMDVIWDGLDVCKTLSRIVDLR